MAFSPEGAAHFSGAPSLTCGFGKGEKTDLAVNLRVSPVRLFANNATDGAPGVQRPALPFVSLSYTEASQFDN